MHREKIIQECGQVELAVGEFRAVVGAMVGQARLRPEPIRVHSTGRSLAFALTSRDFVPRTLQLTP